MCKMIPENLQIVFVLINSRSVEPFDVFGSCYTENASSHSCFNFLLFFFYERSESAGEQTIARYKRDQ